jgi:hypothetical protein
MLERRKRKKREEKGKFDPEIFFLIQSPLFLQICKFVEQHLCHALFYTLERKTTNEENQT